MVLNIMFWFWFLEFIHFRYLEGIFYILTGTTIHLQVLPFQVFRTYSPSTLMLLSPRHIGLDRRIVQTQGLGRLVLMMAPAASAGQWRKEEANCACTALCAAAVAIGYCLPSLWSTKTHRRVRKHTRALDMKSRSIIIFCFVQMAWLGVKSNNGTWIVTKGTPYGKESRDWSIGGDCHQKPLFLQITYYLRRERPECGQGGNLLADGFTDTAAVTTLLWKVFGLLRRAERG